MSLDDLDTLGRVDTLDVGLLRARAEEAAPALLGKLLVRAEADGSEVVARIVETEAYREDDPASHSHAGRTPRTRPMFDAPGTSYVYRSYGIHWCLNVTAEPEGVGAAVLLRAARLLRGHDVVRVRRFAARTDAELLRGPGRLTQALDVDGPRHDHGDLLTGIGGLRLADDGWRCTNADVLAGGRVGVRLAAEVPWRFRLRNVPEVSAYRGHPRAGRGLGPQRLR